MALQSKKTEGGQGGKKGHSQMTHWEPTEDVKKGSRKGRRLKDKELERKAMTEYPMESVKKFISFLESLKDSHNIEILESIKQGFGAWARTFQVK